jgi:diacylglycerol kinase (ATP)
MPKFSQERGALQNLPARVFLNTDDLKQTLFIINPVSARGATVKVWNEARPEIAAAGIIISEHLTAREGEATTHTRAALKNGIGSVVAVGGDGTFNEVVNGYFDEDGQSIDTRASVGLLPSGTGSDFCKSVGMTGVDELIRALSASETRLLDVVRCEFQGLNGSRTSRMFINVSSFGLGGDASALVNGWRNRIPKWIGGSARFAAAAVAALGRYKNREVTLVVDGSEIKVSSNFIVIANAKFAGGGMMLAPHAELDDGLMDLILTDGAGRLDIIKELPRIQRGAHLQNPRVRELRAREISLESDPPMAIDLDGEMVGFTPALLKVVPAAVRFLTAKL